jgi:hypothetical protein
MALLRSLESAGEAEGCRLEGGVLMVHGRVRTTLRTGLASAVVAVLLASSAPALAAKPPKDPKPPKPTNVNVTPLVNGFSTTLNYQIHLGASEIAGVTCTLTFPDGSTDGTCDTTPNSGSGKKLTKFSLTASTTRAGNYAFAVEFDLTAGGSASRSAAFTVQPGPAIRFSVTGLVEQHHVCWFGDFECIDFGPSYPRQIAKITALDAHDNVATGYAGTVSFRVPGFSFTPMGLSDIQLTDGVAYVPVVVPQLSVGAGVEPMRSVCPGASFDKILTATDTVDPTIFGCQSVPSDSSATLRIPESWLDLSGEVCPGGCYQDPTGKIGIDTNVFIPVSLTPVIVVDGTLEMKGFTTTEFYFTQDLTVGELSIIGTSIPTDDLAFCVLCTTDIHYYADNTTGVIDPETGLLIGGSSLQVDGLVVMPWNPPDLSTFVTFESVMASAQEPVCYADARLTQQLIDQSICDLHIVTETP